jgi:hypothetical protein
MSRSCAATAAASRRATGRSEFLIMCTTQRCTVAAGNVHGRYHICVAQIGLDAKIPA